MRKSVVMLVTVLLIMAFEVGCAPKLVPTVTPAAPSAKTAWEETWNKWLAAAKKEGKVVVYSSVASQVRTMLSEAFRDKYGISLEYVPGSSAQLIPKLLAERRAGLFLPDVWTGGGSVLSVELKPEGLLDPIKPILILPDMVDAKNWYEGKIWYLDNEEEYIPTGSLYVSKYVVINTQLVKRDEIKSYRDLLDPKWKGNIVMTDVTKGGVVFTTWFEYVAFVRPELGLDYVRKFAEQKPDLVDNERLVAEWVAHGKRAIGLGIQTALVQEFIRAGAPLELVDVREGAFLSAGQGSISLINRAAHPNAASVFINWLLSKEGNSVLTKVLGVQSAREDVPIPDPLSVRMPGVKYAFGSHEQWQINRPEHLKIAREIFAPPLR